MVSSIPKLDSDENSMVEAFSPAAELSEAWQDLSQELGVSALEMPVPALLQAGVDRLESHPRMNYVSAVSKRVQRLIFRATTSNSGTGLLPALHQLLYQDGLSREHVVMGLWRYAAAVSARAEQAIQALEKAPDKAQTLLGSLHRSRPTTQRFLLENFAYLVPQVLSHKGQSVFPQDARAFAPSYDAAVYAPGLYNFTKKPQQYAFTTSVVQSLQRYGLLETEEDLAGKHVLVLGDGLGGDALYFASKGAQVISVEGSAQARSAQQSRAQELGAHTLKVETQRPEILEYLTHLAQQVNAHQRPTVDIVYAHSVFHLFTTEAFETALALIERVLKPRTGVMAITLRVPGAASRASVNADIGLRLVKKIENPFVAECNSDGVLDPIINLQGGEVTSSRIKLDRTYERLMSELKLNLFIESINPSLALLASERINLLDYNVDGTLQEQMGYVYLKQD